MDVGFGRRVGIARDSGSDTPLVPMMESAEPGQGDHLGIAGRPELNGTMRGCLLPEIVMGPVVVIVGEVLLEDAFQMSLVENDHAIETFSSDGSDKALHVRALPWASWRDQDIFYSHSLDPIPEDIAVDAVPVSEQVFRRCLPGKGLDDLLRGPLGSWIGGDIEIQDSPAVVAKDDQNVDQPEGDRVGHEEVDRNEGHEVISQEGHPGLRGSPWRLSDAFQIPGHGAFMDLKAKEE